LGWFFVLGWGEKASPRDMREEGEDTLLFTRKLGDEFGMGARWEIGRPKPFRMAGKEPWIREEGGIGSSLTNMSSQKVDDFLIRFRHTQQLYPPPSPAGKNKRGNGLKRARSFMTRRLCEQPGRERQSAINRAQPQRYVKEKEV